jgi:hypothetical protein
MMLKLVAPCAARRDAKASISARGVYDGRSQAARSPSRLSAPRQGMGLSRV